MSTESPPAPSGTHDPSERLLERVGRGALAACLLLTVAAALVSGARLALGVLGGGLLSGLSLWTIRASVGALMTAGGRPSGRPSGQLLGLVGRYVLLAFLAYVMIARLRLHPIGLLLGASSVVLAVSAEAVRLLVRGSAH
ncbi:MAG: ATP synthase subunit I [Vicinamibacteraceae bacterium]